MNLNLDIRFLAKLYESITHIARYLKYFLVLAVLIVGEEYVDLLRLPYNGYKHLQISISKAVKTIDPNGLSL